MKGEPAMLPESDTDDAYQLDAQVGYLLRLASQRHAVIFQKLVTAGLTPTQFSTLIRVWEQGAVSQNRLGRLAAMDVATIKGVVDRLRKKELVRSEPDPNDKRRTTIFLTDKGNALVSTLMQDGKRITEETLKPLSPAEQKTFLSLLEKLI
ncbi:MAG: MarR family transcriptional regulator [Pseudomonadota bacterium]